MPVAKEIFLNNVDVISFQLYSLRNYHGLSEQLQLLSDIGFLQVETTRRNYLDAIATRRLLDQNRMRAPTGHFMAADLLGRTDWAINVARTIGIDQVIIPGPFDEEKSFDIDTWRAKGRELGELAVRLADSGLRVAFHNHDGEFAVMPDGKAALDHLFDGAGDAPLFWQADLGWIARAAVDPIPWLTRYSGRVVSCHVKDIAPVGQALDEDGWADVGYGVLDWTKLWAAGRAAGAEWMIVEHDEPTRFEEFPRRSFEFLKSLAA
jgi:sugar phosphate isomerase/epimerase